MLAERVITVEQGMELLDALEEESSAEPPSRHARGFGGLIEEALLKGFGRGSEDHRLAGASRRPQSPRPPRPPQRGHWMSSASPRRQGFSFEDLVELKSCGVPKWYARDMLEVFDDIDVSELIEMQSSGVTVEFAAALRAQFPDLDPAEMVEAVGNGVTVDDLDFFADTSSARGNRRVAADDEHAEEEPSEE